MQLSKKQRLRTPGDFRRVYQSKQWGNSSLYTFNVLPCDLSVDASSSNKAQHQECESSVLGVTVSKKVSKLAVTRNRIKRQIKEYFRFHQHTLVNAQVVITAKPSCAKASDIERGKSLDVLWSKLLKWQRWHQAKN